MAIVLKEQKKGIGWFAVLVFIFLAIVVFGGGYLLFFAATPAIEIVAPSTLKETAKIAEIKFDPATVVNHPVLKSLHQYGSSPGVGKLGRPNPLLEF